MSPSRSSTASCAPVEAPEGTAARPRAPSSSTTSTSTVGLPRLSRISRAMMSVMAVMLARFYRMVLPAQSGGDGSFLALFLAFRARSEEIIPARNAFDESIGFGAARIGHGQGVVDPAPSPRLLREAIKIVPFDEFDEILQLRLDPR